LRLHGASLADIDSPDAADAVYDALHRRLQTLKATGASLHLLPTGGRRLLGMLLLSAAQAVCERTDRIWYVASSDAVRQATRDGAQLHLPGHPEVRLVRVPFTPVGQFIAPLQDPASGRASPAEQARLAGCAEVWRRLTPRQREVLEALRAAGPPNLLQQAANQLAIQPSTLDEHKTRILDVCRDVWQLHEQPRLTVHWLREQFIGFAPRV
jgi:DNA-binding CsgD family transcriptional regulator